MIPEVTLEEYRAEIKRIAKGEPGWSQAPIHGIPRQILAAPPAVSA